MREIFKRGVDEHTAEQGNLWLCAVLFAAGVLMHQFEFAPELAEMFLFSYVFVMLSGFRILVLFDDRSEHRRERRRTAAVLMVLATAAFIRFVLAQ